MPASDTLAIILPFLSAPTNSESKTRQLHSPRSKLITMISVWHYSGHVRVHGIFFGLHRRSVGSGTCAPIIAKEERGWSKHWQRIPRARSEERRVGKECERCEPA